MGSPVDAALDRLEHSWYFSEAATVRSALEQLREERDAARVGHRVLLDAQNELIERAEAAEAEVRRLTEGLRRVRASLSVNFYGGSRSDTAKIIDDLLSASPTDGGGA